MASTKYLMGLTGRGLVSRNTVKAAILDNLRAGDPNLRSDVGTGSCADETIVFEGMRITAMVHDEVTYNVDAAAVIAQDPELQQHVMTNRSIDFSDLAKWAQDKIIASMGVPRHMVYDDSCDAERTKMQEAVARIMDDKKQPLHSMGCVVDMASAPDYTVIALQAKAATEEAARTGEPVITSTQAVDKSSGLEGWRHFDAYGRRHGGYLRNLPEVLNACESYTMVVARALCVRSELGSTHVFDRGSQITVRVGDRPGLAWSLVSAQHMEEGGTLGRIVHFPEYPATPEPVQQHAGVMHRHPVTEKAARKLAPNFYSPVEPLEIPTWELPEGHTPGDFGNHAVLTSEAMRALPSFAVILNVEDGDIFTVIGTEPFMVQCADTSDAGDGTGPTVNTAQDMAHEVDEGLLRVVHVPETFELVLKRERSNVALVDISNPDPGSHKAIGLGIPTHYGWSTYND